MGRPKLPLGKIKTTKKGYLRVWDNDTGKAKMHHRIVWERFNGPVPEGMQVHHIDGNKINNDIGNLELLTPLEHKRIHSGCVIIGEKEYKPCGRCKRFKRIETDYYKNRQWISDICKTCQKIKSAYYKKRKI